jgi:hypothetical protein
LLSECDILTNANLLLQQHGDAAATRAAMVADACMEKGDLEGEQTWLRVMETIRELQDYHPPSNQTQDALKTRHSSS